jgi:hypothetical protein
MAKKVELTLDRSAMFTDALKIYLLIYSAKFNSFRDRGTELQVHEQMKMLFHIFPAVEKLTLHATGSSISESQHEHFPFPSLDLSRCCYSLSYG